MIVTATTAAIVASSFQVVIAVSHLVQEVAEHVATVTTNAQEFIVTSTATIATAAKIKVASAKTVVIMKVAAAVNPLHVVLPIAAIASITLSFAAPGPITGALFPITMGIWWAAYKLTRRGLI
jgi:hypothetical protein